MKSLNQLLAALLNFWTSLIASVLLKLSIVWFAPAGKRGMPAIWAPRTFDIGYCSHYISRTAPMCPLPSPPSGSPGSLLSLFTFVPAHLPYRTVWTKVHPYSPSIVTEIETLVPISPTDAHATPLSTHIALDLRHRYERYDYGIFIFHTDFPHTCTACTVSCDYHTVVTLMIGSRV